MNRSGEERKSDGAKAKETLSPPGHNDVMVVKKTLSDEEDAAAKLQRMTEAVRVLLECCGEDPTREGLVKTPKRMAEALLWSTGGYKMSLETVINGALFQTGDDEHGEQEGEDEEEGGGSGAAGGTIIPSPEMVAVHDIAVSSMCEHHMVPFTGHCTVAYVPNRRSGRVLGLSKMARIVEMFSRRLQVQERLTRQVAEAVMEAMGDAEGVGVMMEASHMCMVMRGVRQHGSSTTTFHLLGTCRTCPQTRAEFFSLASKK